MAAERSLHVDEPFPGGESYRQVIERTRSFLDDVARAHNGERVLVIAHSANYWALDQLVHGTRSSSWEAEFDWRPGWRYVVPANAFSSSSDIE